MKLTTEKVLRELFDDVLLEYSTQRFISDEEAAELTNTFLNVIEKRLDAERIDQRYLHIDLQLKEFNE